MRQMRADIFVCDEDGLQHNVGYINGQGVKKQMHAILSNPMLQISLLHITKIS